MNMNLQHATSRERRTTIRPIAVACAVLVAVLSLTATAKSPVATPEPVHEVADDRAPVRRIAIDVMPYYFADEDADGRPKVKVEQGFDHLLESNDIDSILKFKSAVEQHPEQVSPMALMVLAIRFYDVGRRDDAVFWLYVAKARYTTVMQVLDVQASGLDEFHHAMVSFSTLAGPIINGYAFCNVDKQQRLHSEAFAWVEQHPYAALFRDDLVAKPGDRQENLRKAIESYRAGMGREKQMIQDPQQLAQMREARRENFADEKYCWKE